MNLPKTIPYSASKIELWSGGWLDMADITNTAYAITREDIIIGLSHCCRFAGQCRRFYSVAEHSVLVANLLESRGYDELAVHGLLHDAPEAFIGDMTGPLKLALRGPSQNKRGSSSVSIYDKIDARLEVAINEQFGLEPLGRDEAEEIKRCDNWAFVLESRALLNLGGEGYKVPHDILELGQLPRGVPWYAGLEPLDARDLMRQKWDDLFGSLDA